MLTYTAPRTVTAPAGTRNPRHHALLPTIAAITLTLAACNSPSKTSSESSTTSAPASGAAGTISSSTSESPAAATIGAETQNCENLQAYALEDGTTAYCEEVQNSTGVNAFVGLEDGRLDIVRRLIVGETVLVDCVQRAPLKLATSAQAYSDDAHSVWYHIVWPENVADSYSASNSYWNVKDKRIPFDQQPPIDPQLQDIECGPPFGE